MPLISIIIPAYNAASTIVAALESVAAQTLWAESGELLSSGLKASLSSTTKQLDNLRTAFPYEVIIVDDASTDNTVKVVEKWLSVNGYSLLGIGDSTDTQQPITNNGTVGAWRILRQAQNAGPAAARNAGITVAKGKWIAFLDSDDSWMPYKLELQLRFAAEHPEVALWCGDSIVFAEGEKNVSRLTSHVSHLTLQDLAISNPIICSTVLVRKAATDAVGGFDEQFRGPEDYDLWLRIVASGPAGKIGAVLTVYSERGGSLSMDDRKFLPQVMRVLDKAFSPGGTLYVHRRLRRRAVANQYYSASWMAFWRGSRWRAMWFLWKACMLYPPVGKSNKIRLWCRYLAGSFPGGR